MKGLAKQVAALTLGVVAFAAPLHAQAAQFSLGGSLGIPLGDFDNAAKMGYHIVGAASFKPAAMPVGLQVDANYAHFATEITDVNTQILFATGDAVYTFKTAPASRLHPYLIGGVGIYNTKATGSAVPSGTGSNTDFGINAGAGFNVAAGAASLFVEGRFHDVFTSGSSTQFVPVTLGLRFGGK